MGNIIHLLPDSLANQIAAGEVIQRPASVVKELLENALDAGASKIQLILKDSGKSMIQVVDDGKGMSDVDARMCFERHATSKISKSDDLFQIQSFGFRGEALASIAAVAHVELKTKQTGATLGTHLVIEGSKVKKHDPVQAVEGASFTVKNLFFNVPARRKFLKSDPVELKHILEEFARIALPNPEVHFTVHHNGNELYHFGTGNLRQRLAKYFGKTTNEKIVPVHEETDFVKITGFTGKPELFKKTRGDQYIFVNNRFIKSNYLNHAVKIAYENIIPSNHFPFYVLLLEVDPGMIDVNIHPTKQEIKFENERLIYNLVRVAVRHALGKYSVAPSIDFETTSLHQISETSEISRGNSRVEFRSPPSGERQAWSQFYEEIGSVSNTDHRDVQSIILKPDWEDDYQEEAFERKAGQSCFQVHSSYIISPIKSGVIVIDQQSAHERVLYERYLRQLQDRHVASQKSLFPETLHLNPQLSELLESLMPDLFSLGFAIERFGQHTYIVKAIPADGLRGEAESFIKGFLEAFSANQLAEEDIKANIARSMAEQNAIRRGKELEVEEMNELVDMLFACDLPYTAPSSRKCFITFGLDELQNRFRSKKA